MSEDHETTNVVSIYKALHANKCPICGRYHRRGTKIYANHMVKLYALGYSGYDFDKEKWVTD